MLAVVRVSDWNSNGVLTCFYVGCLFLAGLSCAADADVRLLLFCRIDFNLCMDLYGFVFFYGKGVAVAIWFSW